MKTALSGPVTTQAELLRLAGITLGDDEAMIAFGHIHGAIYWKSVAALIFAIILAVGIPAPELGLFFALVGLIMFVMAHLTRRYLILAATDKRIFVRSGWFYADMVELRYAQVESIELGILPLGQILGYGSVIVTGTGQRRIIVPYITDAVQFRSKVNDILVNK